MKGLGQVLKILPRPVYRIFSIYDRSSGTDAYLKHTWPA